MTRAAFDQSLAEEQPPLSGSVYLKALWFDAKGNWEEAHRLVQDLNDLSAAWIHAYLHRVEGDAFNAGYWYRKAQQKVPTSSLQEEWGQLVNHFLL